MGAGRKIGGEREDWKCDEVGMSEVGSEEEKGGNGKGFGAIRFERRAFQKGSDRSECGRGVIAKKKG
jgi:hypothetical protein